MHKDEAVDALARCVGDVERFASEHWCRSPLLRRGTGDTSYDDLLDLEVIDHLVATTSLRIPAFRLVQDGSPVLPSRYTKRTKQGGRVLDDVADVGRVHELFGEGATIVLQGLQRFWVPITRFCRSVEATLGHPVQANAYVTPPDAQGLGRHEDTHDVFLLQVLGAKHWEVHATASGGEDVPLIDTELEPGDMLYMPKGTPHAARTMKSASIHLTLGVLAVTWADVVQQVLSGATADLGLDDPLPLGYPQDGEGFAREMADRLGALLRWLDGVDAEEVSASMRARFVRSRPPLLTGQLGQLLDLDRIDEETPLRRREGALADLRVRGDEAELVLGDRTLRLPAPFEPVLRSILGADELTAADLHGDLDPASRLVLLRRLVREGLLYVPR